MNCKYCGYSLEDGDENKNCPGCGKPLMEEDVTEAVKEEIREDVEQVTEFDEVKADTEVESETEEFEEVYEVENSEEDTYTQQTDTYKVPSLNVEETSQDKKRGGMIIAAFAAILIVGCIVIVIAVTSLQKKKAATDDNKKQQTVSQPVEEAKEETASGNEDSKENEQQGNLSEDTVDDENIGDYSEYAQYVSKLGDYVGVEVDMVPEEVTDEMVEQEIDSRLQAKQSKEEIKDRDLVQEGDIANIDFTGYKDGKEFEGGKGEKFDLTIGSGQFIPGFEEGLIGAKVGEMVDVEVTFPKEYQNAELAGKEATFKVKVNGIYKEVIPELTDQWCKENSDYKTVEEYKDSVRKELEQVQLNTVQNSKPDRVMQKIYESSTITGYPEGEVEKYEEQIKSMYEYYAQMYGVTVDEFVKSSMGMEKEEYEKQVKESAEQNVGFEIICYCIADKEGMKLTDEEYQEAAKNYAAQYQVQSVEEFEKKYGKAKIYNAVMTDKVLKFVADQAVEVTK